MGRKKFLKQRPQNTNHKEKKIDRFNYNKINNGFLLKDSGQISHKWEDTFYTYNLERIGLQNR